MLDRGACPVREGLERGRSHTARHRDDDTCAHALADLSLIHIWLGTILAFMMSVTVLSIPSLTMLSRVVKPKLLAAFVGICLVGMIISGYVFNWLQPLFV